MREDRESISVQFASYKQIQWIGEKDYLKNFDVKNSLVYVKIILPLIM